MNELTALTILIRGLRARLFTAPQDRQAGYSTEAVVVTALLVAAAITVGGILVAKVVAKAQGLNLG